MECLNQKANNSPRNKLMSKCVILISGTKYTNEHDAFLQNILNQKPDLFSVVGVDCENWEEAMDWILVMRDVNEGKQDVFCNTTSHPNESVDEVLEFANLWCDLKDWKRDVCVLKI